MIASGERETTGVRRGLELLGLASGLFLATGLLARLPGPFPDLARFQPLFTLAFAFYGLTLLRMKRYEDLPRVSAVVIAVAVGARLLFAGLPPLLSDDLYRYLWEGRVLAHGLNPWAFAPSHPALASLRDHEIWPGVNHPGIAAIYPPLSVAGYTVVHWLGGTIMAAKLWVLAHEVALMAILAASLRRTGRSPAWVAAYAWNPLAIVEYAGAGHHDPTAMMWLALALLHSERRPLASALAFAAAALTKLVPLIALPFLWRRWSGTARLLALTLTVVGLAPYAAFAWGADSGLMAYVRNWRNNELIFHYLESWTGDFTAARVLGAGITAVVLLVAWWRATPALEATRLGIRAGLLLGPVVHPWYLGWELIFQPARISWPWLVLSLTAILSYGPLRTPPERGGHHASLEVRWVEYGIPLALALLLLWKRRRNPAPA